MKSYMHESAYDCRRVSGFHWCHGAKRKAGIMLGMRVRQWLPDQILRGAKRRQDKPVATGDSRTTALKYQPVKRYSLEVTWITLAINSWWWHLLCALIGCTSAPTDLFEITDYYIIVATNLTRSILRAARYVHDLGLYDVSGSSKNYTC